jgi:hypothetical protein
VNGFDGNDKIATDVAVSLLQKDIEHFPEKVHYMESANTIMITKPMYS